MEAAAAQEAEVITASKEQTLVVKGKRTKRQRPQSPIPFAAITTTNSSTEDSDAKIDNIQDANSTSPATSAELQDSTDEEEDMANCLILLAQGQSRRVSTSAKQHLPPPATAEATEDGGAGVYKYNSRKFLEATYAPGASGGGKAGYYVYECKTCNRIFPSFQALGGHRASHKKPKTAAAADHMMDQRKNKLFVGLQSDDEDQKQFMIKNNNNISSTALSLQLSNRPSNNNNNNNNNFYGNNHNIKSSNKVHECSICGAEFTSGQALGGHMRRHRAHVGNSSTTTTTSTALSLTTTPLMALDHHRRRHHQPVHGQEHDDDHYQRQQYQNKTRNVLSLDLDLNLPAPDDDQREPKFGFVSKQQQQQPKQQQQQQQSSSLVFSAPALVDCHY